jgi:hypothetical protein
MLRLLSEGEISFSVILLPRLGRVTFSLPVFYLTFFSFVTVTYYPFLASAGTLSVGAALVPFRFSFFFSVAKYTKIMVE